VGDSLEACFKEAGDIMILSYAGEIPKEHFYAELGEIITGKKAGPRQTIPRSTLCQIERAEPSRMWQTAKTGLMIRAVASGTGASVEI